jgi:hypothetical protein
MKKYWVFLFIFCLPFLSFGQDMVNIQKHIIKSKNPPFNDDFEQGLQMATQYILENHHLIGAREYKASVLIVEYWLDKEKWFRIPTETSFHHSLEVNKNLTFLNTVATINYILNQKSKHQRLLKCIPIKGKKYSKQEDCKEVQLNAAKMVLKYCIDNKINVPTETQKYLNAYNTNTLDKVFFKK